MNEPKLRFPEFTGEWEEKKLGEECEITAGGDIPKEKISKEKTEIYKVPIISNGIGNNAIYGYTDSPKITQAAITISARGTIGYAEYREYPYYPIVRLLSVFPKDSTSLNTKYLSYILSIQKYDVTNAGIPQLTVPMIGSVIFHIPPSPAEQDKIASCLSAMDDLIAAQAEKVEALKEKKTGLMQQLFPQPGETTPRLRFPGFTEEWVECTLGEVGDVCMCKRVMKGETNSTSGIPFYKIGTFGKTPDAYIPKELFLEYKKKYSYPSKGDILFSAAGTIGRCVVFDGEPAYFQDSNIVWISNDEKKVHNSFLKYIYSFIDWKIDDGGIVKRLYNDSIRKTSFLKPSSEEQQKIADCLSELDDLIASETKQLEALKYHKKGLMQQLFPQTAK